MWSKDLPNKSVNVVHDKLSAPFSVVSRACFQEQVRHQKSAIIIYHALNTVNMYVYAFIPAAKNQPYILTSDRCITFNSQFSFSKFFLVYRRVCLNNKF